MVQHRFLVITYPMQGHINPGMQFAKRLAAMNNVQVTFATSVYLHRRMLNKPTIPGLSFATFSDGYDDGCYKFASDADFDCYMSVLKRCGSESLRNIIASAKQNGEPFTCVAYSLLVPWAALVAREFQIPGVLLWIQPATVFDIYYYNSIGYMEREVLEKDNHAIELPGLPFSLTKRDVPSFILPSNIYTFALPSFQEHFENLVKETKPVILVNTFEELEMEALRAVDKFTMSPIGPLIPSAFLDGKDPNDTSFGVDMFDASNDYVAWLDSKADFSVVYVSFGSCAALSKRQMEEVARALLDSEYPFMWVIRGIEKEGKEQEGCLSCREELEQKGKIVKWCSQVAVLSHRSLGCFLTHCGWNSTMESLATGVPVVAFPQWSDQGTNAKLVEDVWKTGVRVDGKVNEEGIVEAEEIRKCLDAVMGSGEKGQQLRDNANKWKYLARKAVMEGGSSDKNLRTFLDDVANFGKESAK